MQTKSRNSNIELLRVVLMTILVCYHVTVHGYDLGDIGSAGAVYRQNLPLSLALCCLGTPAVTTFVFISGYFGLHFSWRKFADLLLGCLIVSVGGTLYLHSQGGNTMMDVWRSFFPVTLGVKAGVWWFMTAYIVLYMLSPFLNAGVSHLGKTQLRNLVLLFVVMTWASMLVFRKSAGSTWGGVVAIYLVARYMRFYCQLSMKKAVRVLVISVLLMECGMFILLAVVRGIGRPKLYEMLFCYLGISNPCVIFIAIGLFFTIYRLPAWSNHIVNQLASGSLYIYLITEILGTRHFYEPIAHALDASTWQGCGLILLAVVATLIAGDVIHAAVHLLTGWATAGLNRLHQVPAQQ